MPLNLLKWYEKGREAEILIADDLKRRGWKVLPVYDYSGDSNNKVPRLQANSHRNSLITPDLLIVKDGKSLWCEVKWKKTSHYTRLAQRNDTGIELHQWEQYKTVQRESGIPVYLVFIHQKQQEILGQFIDSLTPIVYEGNKYNNRGMVFFDLQEFATLQVDLTEPQREKNDN